MAILASLLAIMFVLSLSFEFQSNLGSDSDIGPHCCLLSQSSGWPCLFYHQVIRYHGIVCRTHSLRGALHVFCTFNFDPKWFKVSVLVHVFMFTNLLTVNFLYSSFTLLKLTSFHSFMKAWEKLNFLEHSYHASFIVNCY